MAFGYVVKKATFVRFDWLRRLKGFLVLYPVIQNPWAEVNSEPKISNWNQVSEKSSKNPFCNFSPHFEPNLVCRVGPLNSISICLVSGFLCSRGGRLEGGV